MNSVHQCVLPNASHFRSRLPWLSNSLDFWCSRTSHSCQIKPHTQNPVLWSLLPHCFLPPYNLLQPHRTFLNIPSLSFCTSLYLSVSSLSFCTLPNFPYPLPIFTYPYLSFCTPPHRCIPSPGGIYKPPYFLYPAYLSVSLPTGLFLFVFCGVEASHAVCKASAVHNMFVLPLVVLRVAIYPKFQTWSSSVS